MFCSLVTDSFYCNISLQISLFGVNRMNNNQFLMMLFVGCYQSDNIVRKYNQQFSVVADEPHPADPLRASETPDTFWCFGHLMRTVMALQSAIDYACGIAVADCVSIQQCSSCYEPTTLQNNPSFAINSNYYQKNQSPTSCDFGGNVAVTTTNASIMCIMKLF
ncbi:major pollen allergen Ole e 10-like isoform X1 [Rutidosis leptorrhynchoides]|uniref:major pollen allergen Ole e 10-like isoform X1 n=1 Tax=Rutidosis leptorrhynchoides TaxID=125765 RepID=UPI003A98D915